MKMDIKKFLDKFGNDFVAFSELHKYEATYKNTELKIWCKVSVSYRDTINTTELVKSLSDMDGFEFGTL